MKYILIWCTVQIWIRLQELEMKCEMRFETPVRSESVFKMSQSDLNQTWKILSWHCPISLSIPSPICLEMLKFGTFCHFQKALRAPDWFVSLSNLPKIKGLGALCKISLSIQDVRKWLILGMNAHYFMYPLFKISSMFSITILWCWGTKLYSEKLSQHNEDVS